jgi:hypothetical protein
MIARDSSPAADQTRFEGVLDLVRQREVPEERRENERFEERNEVPEARSQCG